MDVIWQGTRNPTLCFPWLLLQASGWTHPVDLTALRVGFVWNELTFWSHNTGQFPFQMRAFCIVISNLCQGSFPKRIFGDFKRTHRNYIILYFFMMCKILHFSYKTKQQFLSWKKSVCTSPSITLSFANSLSLQLFSDSNKSRRW